MKRIIQRNKKLFLALLALTTLVLPACKKDNQAAVPPTSIRPVTAGSNAYVTDLFDFNPAPGQFTNTALADTAAAKATLKTDKNLVSLGAWGGYIVLGFDHTVINQKDSADFIIYGNAFAKFSEPGVVWVMQDTNGNGKPDDSWYEIKGSAYGLAGYVKNYTVTYTRPACDTCSVPWKDGQGKTGVVQTNVYHKQAYFPIGIKGNTVTYTGSLLPATNIDASNPGYITSSSWAYGYADNTAGGDKIDIATAVDANGNAVQLKGIDFIKVQTGIQYNMGWLGELSTEFGGAADLSLLKH